VRRCGLPASTEASKLRDQAAELLDRASSDPAFVERANQQHRRKRGRNERCWCGSGKKYKRCHWDRDRDAGGTGRLPAMSDHLQRLCDEVVPRPDATDLEAYRRILKLASLAWNRSRMPRQRRREDLRELLGDGAVGEDRDALVGLIEHLTAVAEEVAPDDPRLVVEARLIDRGVGFQILASYTRPG